MLPGVAGVEPELTVSVWAVELPHGLLAITETVPPLAPAVALILNVVEVPLQPFGSVQVYEVAPLTALTENVSKLPAQSVPDGVIVPGVAGPEPLLTVSVCAVELPQPMLAVTETVPPFAPVVALILNVVEVPLQPFGRVQVYEVAPFTALTENVSKPPGQPAPVCEMLPGVTGAEPELTVSVCAVELPHPLLAVTETVPPLAPVVALILNVVEVPLQPLGSVQV